MYMVYIGRFHPVRIFTAIKLIFKITNASKVRIVQGTPCTNHNFIMDLFTIRRHYPRMNWIQ